MIGVDIEKPDRFLAWTDKEYARIFTKQEIEYAKGYENATEHFCGFFCVKEALVKALDKTDLEFKKIEILHTDSGKPYLNFNNYVKKLLDAANFSSIQVSISHCKDYSTAVVLLK